MHYSTAIALLASLGVSLARPAVEEARAIVPTVAGQIGINPVVVSEYIGTNTQYFSYASATAQWIGPDSVIIDTITTTINNAPVTTTSSVLIEVRTATAEADGRHVGDVDVTVTPEAARELEGVFQDATNSCAKSKHKRQDGGLPCELQYLAHLIESGATVLAGVDFGGATWKDPGAAIVGAVGSDFLLGAAAGVFEGIPLVQAIAGIAYAGQHLYGAKPNVYLFPSVEVQILPHVATTTSEAFPPYFTNFIAEQANPISFDLAHASSLASYWQGFFSTPATAVTTGPPAPTNSAIKLTCATTGPSFGRDVVLAKATEFCTNAISKGWSSSLLGGIDSTNSNPFSAGSQFQDFFGVIPDQKNYALRFKVQVLKSGEACNPGSTVGLDFVALGQDKCVWDLMNALDGCSSTQGGTTLADCAQWDVNSIAGLG